MCWKETLAEGAPRKRVKKLRVGLSKIKLFLAQDLCNGRKHAI
jgi:hypothetical protein